MIDKKMITFIQNIFKSTTGIEVHYLTPPYDNITKIDRFLRKNIWANTDYYSLFTSHLIAINDNTIYNIADRFSSYSALLKIPDSEADYLFFGPYMIEEQNEEFYKKIIETNNLGYDMLLPLKQYYSELPTVDSAIMVSSYNSIGSLIFDDKTDFNMVYMEETWNNNNLVIDYIPNPEVSLAMSLLEERYNDENTLIMAVSKGDRNTATDVIGKLANMKLQPRTKDPIRNKKNQGIILNTLCRKAAEQSFIHPIYLDEISTRFAIDIEKLTTMKALDELTYEMIKKYCLLVQNYSLKDYSSLIQKTLNYINFNMSKPITLKTIATEFSVNPNYLSTLFKKEVQMTLTEYINKQRINLAVKMLNTKDMQIQDIAWHVGINDVNYFTKLFKKIIGYTPTEYKKQIWKDSTSLII